VPERLLIEMFRLVIWRREILPYIRHCRVGLVVLVSDWGKPKNWGI